MTWSVLYRDEGQEAELDPVIKSVKWSGDLKQASRKMIVELSNSGDLRETYFKLRKGGELRLMDDGGRELFRGVIFADSIDSRGQMSLTAYDENIYLTKNKDTKIFRNQTAAAIVKKLCSEFGIPAGDIHDTGFVIPKLVLRDKTLYEMMIIALTESWKQTGEAFVLTSREGKLQLLARKEQKVKWVLENGVNVLSASYSQSIEELRTQIKVVGDDNAKKELTANAKSSELIKLYGVMQHLEKPAASMSNSQMQERAQQLLKKLGTIEDEARIECLGITEVISGASVHVMESMTGIIGGYYVSADEHRFEKGGHTMSLTLSASDDIPKMEYKEPRGG